MGGKQTKTNRKGRKKASESNEISQAREQFKRGVLARGEASKPAKGGKLPPGATHEIVGDDIVRKQFSAI